MSETFGDGSGGTGVPGGSLSSRPVRHRGGVPVYDYRRDPAIPPITVSRFAARDMPDDIRPHIHDFPALLYLPGPGEVYVVAAGQVIDRAAIGTIDKAVAVFFDPAAAGDEGRAPRPTWRTHPLLFPFAHTSEGGVLRLPVPEGRRGLWANTIAAIETEFAQHRLGYRQAAQAHLTVLLIEIARMAGDIVGNLRGGNEPLLAAVFDIIEHRYHEPLSLRDVAAAVNMTPGHVTTVVRRQTGRTVQDWITERRMAKARTLLTTTDLPIAEIGRRVGIPDPGYFTRVFRRRHGSVPRLWRGLRTS